MAIAKKRSTLLGVAKDAALNIILIASTLTIVLVLAPFGLLYWFVLLVIGNVKAVSNVSTGRRLLKNGKADMLTLDAGIKQLLGVDESGRKNSISWVREKRRRSLALQLIEIRRKSFPNEKIKYLG